MVYELRFNGPPVRGASHISYTTHPHANVASANVFGQSQKRSQVETSQLKVLRTLPVIPSPSDIDTSKTARQTAATQYYRRPAYMNAPSPSSLPLPETFGMGHKEPVLPDTSRQSQVFPSNGCYDAPPWPPVAPSPSDLPTPDFGESTGSSHSFSSASSYDTASQRSLELTTSSKKTLAPIGSERLVARHSKAVCQNSGSQADTFRMLIDHHERTAKRIGEEIQREKDSKACECDCGRLSECAKCEKARDDVLCSMIKYNNLLSRHRPGLVLHQPKPQKGSYHRIFTYSEQPIVNKNGRDQEAAVINPSFLSRSTPLTTKGNEPDFGSATAGAAITSGSVFVGSSAKLQPAAKARNLNGDGSHISITMVQTPCHQNSQLQQMSSKNPKGRRVSNGPPFLTNPARSSQVRIDAIANAATSHGHGITMSDNPYVGFPTATSYGPSSAPYGTPTLRSVPTHSNTRAAMGFPLNGPRPVRLSKFYGIPSSTSHAWITST